MMTEADFIFAWLLASRVNPSVRWTDESTLNHINKAKQIYRKIMESSNATNR
jgi:hypothetical protein